MSKKQDRMVRLDQVMLSISHRDFITIDQLRDAVLKANAGLAREFWDVGLDYMLRKRLKAVKDERDGRSAFLHLHERDEEGNVRDVYALVKNFREEDWRAALQRQLGLTVPMMRKCNEIAKRAVDHGFQLTLPFPELETEEASGS